MSNNDLTSLEVVKKRYKLDFDERLVALRKTFEEKCKVYEVDNRENLEKQLLTAVKDCQNEFLNSISKNYRYKSLDVISYKLPDSSWWHWWWGIVCFFAIIIFFHIVGFAAALLWALYRYFANRKINRNDCGKIMYDFDHIVVVQLRNWAEEIIDSIENS